MQKFGTLTVTFFLMDGIEPKFQNLFQLKFGVRRSIRSKVTSGQIFVFMKYVTSSLDERTMSSNVVLNIA